MRVLRTMGYPFVSGGNGDSFLPPHRLLALVLRHFYKPIVLCIASSWINSIVCVCVCLFPTLWGWLSSLVLACCFNPCPSSLNAPRVNARMSCENERYAVAASARLCSTRFINFFALSMMKRSRKSKERRQCMRNRLIPDCCLLCKRILFCNDCTVWRVTFIIDDRVALI